MVYWKKDLKLGFSIHNPVRSLCSGPAPPASSGGPDELTREGIMGKTDLEEFLRNEKNWSGLQAGTEG